MEITIDLGRLAELGKLNFAQLLWLLISRGGWIILVVAILAALFYWRLYFKRKEYLLNIKHSLLAIDIPKDNEQSLLAMEQIFAQLHAIKSGPTLWEKYWIGKTQVPFCLEIVSIEGYIQFLLRVPEQFRNLLEAAVYAQYPEAEITEVEDYMNLIPSDIYKINHDFKIWGSELNFAKPSAFPIRTYKTFEHNLNQVFIDPMASLLEVMSKLGKDEQVGLQLILAPVGDNWKDNGYRLVQKLIGAHVDEAEHIGDKFVKTSLSWLERFSEAIYQLWGDIKTKDDKKDNLPNLIQYLTAGEKIVVEAIQNKLSKLTFATSFRIYYMAKADNFQRGLGVNAIIGAINQFNTSDQNAFVRYKKLTTDADYFFIKSRISYKQKKLLKLYRLRSRKGSPEFYLSTEELATIYHFPTLTVKAPLLQRTVWKKAKPPTTLPLETLGAKRFFTPVERKSTAVEPPIPEEESKRFIIEESLPDYNFDNDYFEEKFGNQSNPKPAAPNFKDNLPPNLPFVD